MSRVTTVEPFDVPGVGLVGLVEGATSMGCQRIILGEPCVGSLVAATAFHLGVELPFGEKGFADYWVEEDIIPFVGQRRLLKIRYIGVEEEHQGRGYGHALMRAGKYLARELECDGIAVCEPNDASRNIAEDLGITAEYDDHCEYPCVYQLFRR